MMPESICLGHLDLFQVIFSIKSRNQDRSNTTLFILVLISLLICFYLGHIWVTPLNSLNPIINIYALIHTLMRYFAFKII